MPVACPTCQQRWDGGAAITRLTQWHGYITARVQQGGVHDGLVLQKYHKTLDEAKEFLRSKGEHTWRGPQ